MKKVSLVSYLKTSHLQISEPPNLTAPQPPALHHEHESSSSSSRKQKKASACTTETKPPAAEHPLRELPVLKREGRRREEAGNKARNEMEVCSEMGERAEKKGRVHGATSDRIFPLVSLFRARFSVRPHAAAGTG